MASTRFPGKPLAELAGKPMVQWVHERARASGLTETVVIATPDAEIQQAATGFGAEVVMTRSDHPSGTDRLAEVATKLIADVYVNVQGDEPLIDPESIRSVAAPFADPSVVMASVYSDCAAENEDNPAVVKVVTDTLGNALYFSRFAIPFARNSRTEPLKQHIGIYAYRREVLLKFPGFRQTQCEIAEGLEQLRMLENGIPIRMVKGRVAHAGVDTPEQAEIARRILLGNVRA